MALLIPDGHVHGRPWPKMLRRMFAAAAQASMEEQHLLVGLAFPDWRVHGLHMVQQLAGGHLAAEGQVEHLVCITTPTSPQRVPPPLIEDVIREILLRLPPSDPSCLVRGSSVCKAWRTIVTDPAFLRRYHHFHQTPLLVGFVQNDDDDDNEPVARFAPTTTFRPTILEHPGCRVLDSRHGRVLLQDLDSAEFVVWDPMTGVRLRIPVPEVPGGEPWAEADCNAAILCTAGAGCDHNGCPYLVASVRIEDYSMMHGFLFSSETAAWSMPTSVQLDQDGLEFIRSEPAALVGNSVCFLLELSMILQYDLERQTLSMFDYFPLIEENLGLVQILLLPAEDGMLGVATLFGDTLCLWSRETGADGVAGWAQMGVISLQALQPVPVTFPPWIIAGYSDVSHAILVCTNDHSVIAISLSTLLTSEVCSMGRITQLSFPYYLGI